MWIEVQRKNRKAASPKASPEMDGRSPLRPLNLDEPTEMPVLHKRIRPPPGFPELENIEPTYLPREPDLWTHHKTMNETVNWRDKNVRP